MLSVLIFVMHHLESPKLLLELLVDHGQVANVLRGIVNHVLCKGSVFPEALILAHDRRDLVLLSVHHVDVCLE